jgi:hypothetical protein
MESIDNYLTFEVKKEIADRYFGFRKAIEDDSNRYLQDVFDCSRELEKGIGHDLVRIYTLLNSESLIDEFIDITHLPPRIFVDSYINTLPKKDTIFRQQKFRGLTRKGCLNNMFFDTYERLADHIGHYRKIYNSLQEDQETIVEQINLFYRKNDIETIFHFLRSLDNTAAISSPTTAGQSDYTSMASKLRLTPPPAINELLPEIPEIPEQKTIKKELKNLVRKACRQQPLLDLRDLKKSS